MTLHTNLTQFKTLFMIEKNSPLECDSFDAFYEKCFGLIFCKCFWSWLHIFTITHSHTRAGWKFTCDGHQRRIYQFRKSIYGDISFAFFVIVDWHASLVSAIKIAAIAFTANENPQLTIPYADYVPCCQRNVWCKLISSFYCFPRMNPKQ